MSDISLANDGKGFNCPACGAEESIPERSIVRQESPYGLFYVEGTCEVCRSTRTLGLETASGELAVIALRAVLDTSGDVFMWQAQWYDADSQNDDHYERGGFYETPREAIDGAKRGKQVQDMFKNLF